MTEALGLFILSCGGGGGGGLNIFLASKGGVIGEGSLERGLTVIEKLQYVS